MPLEPLMGAKAGRAIKLVPRGDVWDVELLLACKGLAWDRARRDVSAKVVLPAAPQVIYDLPPPPERHGGAKKRIYIRPGIELAKYGSTAGCPGCMAVALGARAQAHCEECRARVEKAMADDMSGGGGAERMEQAAKRRAVDAPADMQADARPPVQQEGGASSVGGCRKFPVTFGNEYWTN